MKTWCICKKIKIAGICLIIAGSFLSSHSHVFAGALPGSMSVSAKSTYSTGESITINWTASANATKYGLSVWKPPYGNDKYLVFDNYVTGTSKNIGTLPAGTYQVNMMPYNDSGGGPISNIIYFTVAAPAAPVLPGSMTMSAKSTYSTGENITISWTASSNATKYGLSVWKPPYNSDAYLVWDNFVTGTSKNIGALPAGSYRANMKPYNDAGGGTDSNSIDFTVVAPVVVAPAPIPAPIPTPVSTQTPTPSPNPASASPSIATQVLVAPTVPVKKPISIAPVSAATPSTLPSSIQVSTSKATFSTEENVVINWTSSTNADKYGLSVWKPPYGNDKFLVFDDYVTGNSKDIGKLPADNYRIIMKPYGPAGGGPDSSAVDFTVAAPAAVSAPAKAPVAVSAPAKASGNPVATFINNIGNTIINWWNGLWGGSSKKTEPTPTPVPVQVVNPKPVTNDPRFPVDVSLRGWYGLTYPNHESSWKYQYSAIDLHLDTPNFDFDKGQPVYAIQDGNILSNGNSALKNDYRVIEHSTSLTLKNGTVIKAPWYSLYGHMASPIAEGTKNVKKGTVIGYISNMGVEKPGFSSGPNHLHFSIFRKYGGGKENAISPYWLPGDYSNKLPGYKDDRSLYADDANGTRNNGGEVGLYENRIFSAPPQN